MYRRNRIARARRGFTLLEILIVVGILALLAAFVVPNLMQRGQQAKEDIARSAVGRNGAIADALNTYKLYAGKYPTTQEGLEALFKRPAGIDDKSPKWKGPYLDGTPDSLRDPWDNEYIYVSPGKFNADSYDLSSKGADGDEGTEDDITNWTKD